MRSTLRKPCRVAPGQLAADVCDLATQATSTRADDGDLPGDVIVRGVEARFDYLERNPGDIAGAVRAQRAVLDPHIDRINGERDARARKDLQMATDNDCTDDEDCMCPTCDLTGGDGDDYEEFHVDHDSDDYTFDGGSMKPEARHRRDAELLNTPSAYRTSHSDGVPEPINEDTDEEAAKARMRATSLELWRK